MYKKGHSLCSNFCPENTVESSFSMLKSLTHRSVLKEYTVYADIDIPAYPLFMNAFRIHVPCT